MAEFDIGEGEPIKKDSLGVGEGETLKFDIGDGEPIGGVSSTEGANKGSAFKEGSFEIKDLALTAKAFGGGKFGQAVGAYSYAAAETLIDLSPITFMKYMRTKDRDDFASMSNSDKARELLWETTMSTLWVALGIGVGKAVKGLAGLEKAYVHPLIAKNIKKLKGQKPLPSQLNYPEYTSKGYRKEAVELMSKQENVSEKEALAIVEHIQGNPNASNLLSGEQSPAFKVIAKKLDNGLLLKKGLLEKYSPKRVQIEMSRQRFADNAAKVLGVEDKHVILSDIEAMYKGGLRKLYGKPKYEASYTENFKDAAPELLDDMTRWIMDSPKSASRAARLYLKPSPLLNAIQPTRFVAERLEPALKMWSKVFNPVKSGGDAVTKAHLVNIQEFMSFAAKRGLAKESRLAGKVGYKRTGAFTKERTDAAFAILRELDNVTQAVSKSENPKFIAEAKTHLKSLIEKRVPDPNERRIVGHIVDTTRDWFDKLYVKQALTEIPAAFERIGMSSTDREGLSIMFRDKFIGGKRIKGIESKIQDLFNPDNAKNYGEKISGFQKILEELQGYAQSIGGDAESITRNLSMKSGDFTKYLDNYFPRIAKKEIELAEKMFRNMPKDQKAFYTKSRYKQFMEEPPVDFEDSISRYSRANARSVTGYYQVMDDAINHLDSVQSEAATEYFKHWIGRKLGMPTKADVGFAEFLDSASGLLDGKFGISLKGWDARRVMNMSSMVQNAAISGFLGFKPFSMARNMFQPLVMTPAELGKGGFTHLVKGLKHAFTPNHIREMKQLEIFTAPMPDYERSLKFLRFGKGREKLGFELPTYQGVVDATLTGYKGSDALNRIWSSGAAKSQWLKGLRAIGVDEKYLKDIKMGVPDIKIAKKFLHNIEVHNRTDIARYNIETLIGKGKWYEAYATHIKDIVANTQFLYGVDDSPLALQPIMGSTGRALTVFQSWWMNYGQAMVHWMATGAKPSDKLMKAFNWSLSGLIAYKAMEKMWGSDVALRSTLLGPLPSSYELMNIPLASPVTLMVTKGMETVFNAGLRLPWSFRPGADQEEVDKSLKALDRSFKAYLRSTTNLLVPSGLVLRQVGERAFKAPKGKKLEEAARAFAGLKEKKKIPLAR